MPLLSKTRIVIGEMNGSDDLKKYICKTSSEAGKHITLENSVPLKDLEFIVSAAEEELEEYRRLMTIKSTLTTLINEMKKAKVDEIMIL